MSTLAATLLRLRLTTRYVELRRKLERIVGSKEDAAEALHETWERLEGARPVGQVANPDAYLLRMATNIAYDFWRRHEREELMSEAQQEALLDIVDESSDPERILGARLDVDALQTALDELPHRQRAIFIAARVDALSNDLIAKRYRISVSMVKKELAAAMRHCRNRLADCDAVVHGDLIGRRGQ